MSFSIETVINQFWLLAILVNAVNALIWWFRAQPHIQNNSALRVGYTKLIRGFFLGTTAPWLVMGLGMTAGGIANIADYWVLQTKNPFVVAWWISIWTVILLLSYWIWFRGGAESLIKYPGLLSGSPNSPQAIKRMWLLAVMGSVIAVGVAFFLKPS
ncbi:hypothetical protein [Rivularia sp. UHCC 0363]|uniref:hypothetical protein n=1 Tax=Rivularia sp. UHCC 0363 TaxID=3110244 RepID=UPI002B1EA5C7|nr:hypothetical protein [Rivularia sp. UHCC 0363]MEA5597326.1 hypothetical protein [Rivularia sp. UHCC 0363]